MTEDEMIGCHHRHGGQEFEQALGVGDGQGRLACCSPWGCKELEKTQQLNNIQQSTDSAVYKQLFPVTSRRPHSEIGTMSCDDHVILQSSAPVSPGYDTCPGCSNDLSYGEWPGYPCLGSHRTAWLLIPRMIGLRGHIVHISASRQGSLKH